MKLDVDPAQLRTAADRVDDAAARADRARVRTAEIPHSAVWAPDLGVQGAFSEAKLVLEQWITTTATASRELADSMRSAAHGYEATELALSGRERVPE